MDGTGKQPRWPMVKLGDVCEIQNGYAFDSKYFNQNNIGVPLIRIRSLKLGVEKETYFDGAFDSKYLVNAGDLLIGMDGDFTCYPWRGETALLNQRVCRLINFKENILPEFILYTINKYLKMIENVTAYSTVKHLSSKTISLITLPLPPLAEQQRIVARLDAAFAAIDEASAAAASNARNARALFESYLDQVFSQRGAGWVETTLGTLCDIKHGYAFQGSYFENNGEYALLTPGNFYETGGFRERGNKQKFYNHSFPSEYILNKGDLLIAMTEQAAGLLGSPLIVPESNKYLHNQRLGLVISKVGDKINNEFLFHLFNTTHLRNSIQSSSSGVKVRHTSPNKIKEIKISIPLNIHIQQTIASTMTEISHQTTQLTTIYERKVAALAELKQSLLAEVFGA